MVGALYVKFGSDAVCKYDVKRPAASSGTLFPFGDTSLVRAAVRKVTWRLGEKCVENVDGEHMVNETNGRRLTL